MKETTAKPLAVKIAIFSTSFILFLAAFVLFCSFTTARLADDLFKQLGIAKTAADEKIMGSLLGGGLDAYGVKNAKNIALGNRKAVVLDLIAYTKKQATSAAFIKQYNEMRDRFKPKEKIAQTPEAMRTEEISRAKQFVADMETQVKKADASMKPIFEKSVVEAKKNLQRAEDPNNKHHVAYAKDYEGLVKMFTEDYQRQLAAWESKYPANQLLYVKKQLTSFINQTADIDFGAELVTKNGKKYFVNRAYESKGNNWKMAFRAGKEVIETAREAVQKWMDEVK